jgi:hypothetical protein
MLTSVVLLARVMFGNPMAKSGIIGKVDSTLNLEVIVHPFFVLYVKSESQVLPTDVADCNIVECELTASNLLFDLAQPLSHPGEFL